MKLVLVIPSLGGGGAERVMSALANAWVTRGHAVTLVTLAGRERDCYPLDAAVERVALGVARRSANPLLALARNLGRIRALRHVLRAAMPDAVLSFTTRTNVLVLLAAGRARRRVIVSERTAPGSYAPGAAWAWLRRRLYRRAGAVVAQTRRGADALAAIAGCTVEVIPNPVPPTFGTDAPPPHPGPARTLLAVGRLAPEKGFDLLIEAFARIAGEVPEWHLVIAGEGPLRDALARRIDRHRLAGRVTLAGFTRDVRARLRAADLYVLSSRFEGFPNALLEAMAEGLACVSFDCATGPRELITHARSGWLVPPGDAAALAAALATLMRDADLRARLGAGAREAAGGFALPAVIGKWNRLLAAASAPSRARRAALTAEAK